MVMITKHKLAEKVKKLREEMGLSQEDLSKKLGVQRPIISNMESGQREISSIELGEIAKIFEVSVDDLLSDGRVEKRKKGKIKVNPETPLLNRGKFKEVILYILEKCGAKANVGETVLYKLLYFSDFDFYEMYETFLTGASYRKINYGPAPCGFQEIVDEMIKGGQLKKITAEYYGKPQKKYIPLVNSDIKNWTAREKEVIDKVIERLSSMDAANISEYSHGDIPWEVSAEKEIIDYDSVFYRKSPYSMRTYTEE
ncbi:MAG: DUF4065 domain-containing protein [Candidatus Omnitrophica bacterium]|nr:DUF4065 domain-containing protein [Candidatus Omnitrophota bacterium]